jgi:hypothetical protein
MNDNLCYTVILYYDPVTGPSVAPGRCYIDRLFDGSAVYLGEITEWVIV